MSARFSGSVDSGWQPHVLSGVRWLLTFWLSSVFLLQQFYLPHRLLRLSTGRSATQHGPLYREERHSARSFVQGGAPLSTVLCTGRSATQHGPLYREERRSARSFVQGGAPLSTVLCTGRSATQHGPLYREEHHSARSFVQGGAPLSTVLSSVFPGFGVNGKGSHGDLQIVFETLILLSL